ITTVPLYSGAMPDRNSQDAATFTTNYIDWLNYQPTNITGMNVTVGEINLATAQVTADKDAAATSAAAAQAAGNHKGAWSAQTGAAAKPYAVSHNGDNWSLVNALADVTLSEPGVTTDWINSDAKLAKIKAVSSPYTVLQGDSDKILVFSDASLAVLNIPDGLALGTSFMSLNTGNGGVTANNTGTDTVRGVKTLLSLQGYFAFTKVTTAIWQSSER
ncbi:MAG: hypothetical protein GY746_18635, partial [Gammaproteobacteria bacterium]|nr:hypothetical protein [Gammaproteobacteria bacterium]